MEEQAQMPVAGADAAATMPEKRKTNSLRWDRVVLSAVIAVLVWVVWQSWSNREELRRTQIELARRITDGDSIAAESRALASQVQENLESLQNKIGIVEGKIEEAQGQYTALEGMYSEFARARDERTFAEIEQALNIANQQLQLAGNVQAAIAALQSADGRLALLDQVRFLPLRKLVARDIERLKALPLADITALALRLDTMMGRVDGLPLGYERTLPGRPLAQEVAAAKTSAASAPAYGEASAPAATSRGFVTGLLADMWNEFRQLVRVERLDQPDPALMAPAGAAYLRENVRLRLLSARLALLQRDGRLFSEDVRQARVWLERYFDVQTKPVADMLGELRQIEDARLTVGLPSLDETATALHNLKLGGKR